MNTRTDISKYIIHSVRTPDQNDFSKLTVAEIRYAKNPLKHLDFIIYNTLGKVPLLGIEGDGFEFHKEGSTQSKRDKMKDAILGKYHFPILRGTNESNER